MGAPPMGLGWYSGIHAKSKHSLIYALNSVLEFGARHLSRAERRHPAGQVKYLSSAPGLTRTGDTWIRNPRPCRFYYWGMNDLRPHRRALAPRLCPGTWLLPPTCGSVPAGGERFSIPRHFPPDRKKGKSVR